MYLATYRAKGVNRFSYLPQGSPEPINVIRRLTGSHFFVYALSLPYLYRCRRADGTRENYMKEKFMFKSMLMGALVCMTLGLASCSDDDFTTQLEIGGDVLTEGIEAEIDGMVTTLSITSNDNWTIDVPEDASHWVYIPVKEGKGNRNVPVSIDSNFGSSVGRNTTITITAGDVVQKVAVTQVPTYNGEAVANADEAVDYVKIAETKGVGLGLNLGNLETYNNNVINLNAVSELQKINKAKYGNLFTYDIQAEAAAQGAVIDSVDTKKDSLGVALQFDINYGDFKLTIGGAYHGDESKDHYKTEYKYGATYNIASASTDMASLVASYNKVSTSNNDDSEETDWMRCLYTPGFIDAKEEVELALAEKDTEWFNEAMESLVGQYGPVVISGCDLGGSISLWMKYNRDSIADIIHVDTAHIKVAVTSGILKVSANVEVGYKKEGIKVLENSSFKYHITGGAKNAQDAVASVLSTQRQKGDDDVVYTELHDNIDAWISSLDGNDATTLSYTRLKIYPMWYFFKNTKEAKARNEVKKWIQENYKDDMDIINNGALDADVSDE